MLKLRPPYLGEPRDEYEDYLIDEHTVCRLKHEALVTMEKKAAGEK